MEDMARLWNINPVKVPHWNEPTHVENILSHIAKGTNHAWRSPEEDAKRLLKEFDLEEFGIGTVGGKVDTVIETSGAASSINMGIRLLRPGGKYVQMGVGKAKIEFPIVALSNKQLMFRGCFRYDAGDYELAVKLIAKGLVQVKPLISSVTLFEDATKAWEKTENGEGIENSIEDVKD
ncbi:oxidoreductase [Ascochyta rabiei]|uniref:Oxidoreductase n=1 Tax=Didymella rabiei TaxID=5454 RepID=A0A163HRX2_DIDRA|nr:oxidoreductase [Ascochyta rabiei]